MSALLGGCGDDESTALSGADADGDGWPAPLDCADNDPEVFPGADEIPYDGIDQDCSGSDLTDLDQDGFDGGETGSHGEGGAAGAASAAEDCDDHRPDVHPASVEVCGDGIDQDCSGADQPCDELDRDRDGVTAAEGDCNDLDANIGPQSDEVYYNGVDDDCDPSTRDSDQDADGFSRDLGADCNDEDADVFPGADEIPYDGIDQDCSGADLVDVDGDGVPGGPGGSDCDDFDATVRPGRHEVVVDGIDQNCDGSDLAGVDELVRFTDRDAVPASGAAIAAGVDGDGEPVALAAWPDSRNATNQDVYAQLLNETGRRVGSEIIVVEAGLSKSDVRVAAHESVFLVTWRTSEGVFAQLVSGEGERIANDLPIGAAGGAGVDVSYGPDNFAVVWRQTDADPVEVRVRGVTPEGVRGDNNVVFAGSSSAVAVASTPEEHMVFWTGEAGYGLFAHRVNGRGEPIGDVLEISELGPLGPIAATAAGARYAVVLQQSGPTQSTRGFIVDVAGDIVVGGESGLRLSQESFSIPDVVITGASSGFFAGWQDLRHITATPALQAIYYNGFDDDGTPWFTHDRALHADVGVELGGAARVGDHVLVLSRNAFGLGVLPVPR